MEHPLSRGAQTLDGIGYVPSVSPDLMDMSAAAQQELPHLHASFSWMLAGNVIFAICQWGMLIEMAKLGDAVMIGQFSLGLAISTPILMFTNLQLRAVQATDAERQYRFGDYLSLRVIMSGAALFVIFAIVWVGHFNPVTARVILAVAGFKAVESISDIIYGLFQREERLDKLARSLILRGIGAVVVLGSVLYRTGSAFWSLVAVAGVWIMLLLAHDIPGAWPYFASSVRHLKMESALLASRLRSMLQLRFRVSLVRLAFPLGVVTVLVSLNTNIPRYFIEGYIGEKLLGIYSAVAYPVAAITTVVDALGHAATPRLAKYYCAGQMSAFRLILLKLVSIGLLFGALAVLIVTTAGARLLSLVYRPEYSELIDLFVLFIVAASLGGVASLLMFGLTSARRFSIQIAILGLVVLASVVGCKLWVPTQGLMGAAHATVLASVVQLTVAALVTLFSLGRSR